MIFGKQKSSPPLKYSIILAFCLLYLPSFCQNKIIKEKLFFGSDESSLNDNNKQKLDHLFDTISPDSILKVLIKGYADNTRDSLYNVQLSEKRCKSVFDHFLAKGVNTERISVYYFGADKPAADNTTDAGKQQNRRTEIVISYHPVITLQLLSPLLIMPAKHDTTLYLNGGVQVTVDTGVMHRIFCCTNMMSSMRAGNNIMHRDSNNAVMADSINAFMTLGEIWLNVIPECFANVDTCFSPPIKVRFPLPKELQPTKDIADMIGVYDLSMPGRWTQMHQMEGVIKLNGKLYFEEEMSCLFHHIYLCCNSFYTHCDTNVTIKAPKGYAIQNAAFFIKKKWGVKIQQGFKETDMPANKISLCICYEDREGNYSATLTNKKGDTIFIEAVAIKEMKHRKPLSICSHDCIPKQCKHPGGKSYRIYVIRRRQISNAKKHRAYKIQPRSLLKVG